MRPELVLFGTKNAMQGTSQFFFFFFFFGLWQCFKPLVSQRLHIVLCSLGKHITLRNAWYSLKNSLRLCLAKSSRTVEVGKTATSVFYSLRSVTCFLQFPRNKTKHYFKSFWAILCSVTWFLQFSRDKTKRYVKSLRAIFSVTPPKRYVHFWVNGLYPQYIAVVVGIHERVQLPPGNQGTQGLSLNTQGLSRRASLEARGRAIRPSRVVPVCVCFQTFNATVAQWLNQKRGAVEIDDTSGVLFVLIARDFLIARSAHRGIIWIAKIFVLEAYLPIWASLLRFLQRQEAGKTRVERSPVLVLF